METTTVKLYSLHYSNVKTYWAASLFIIGNILFPKLFHLIPQGGITWLPIYFFTLIGAYKYGWKVGLLTAVLSPAINSLLFSMPAPATLPVIQRIEFHGCCFHIFIILKIHINATHKCCFWHRIACIYFISLR